jgi:defect in organelle trafficking protein DotC
MMIINRSKSILTIGATVLVMLTSCAYSGETPSGSLRLQSAQTDTQSLYQPSKTEISDVDIGYVKVDQFPAGKGQINPIRWQALYETALSLGATGALAWRSEQIDMSLNNNMAELDKVFDFNQLLLKDNVLPPVLVESDNSLNLANNDSIRLAAKTYKIISPARFVTAAPSWRSYLTMRYAKPTVPDRSLLPRNQVEAEVWNRFIREGWQNGIQQANAIFAANLSRLRRDYNGMVLYRKMLAQDMVSAPYVAKADLGVTGDSKEMRIDDRILRITAHSELQTDSSKWQPILVNPQQELQP